VNLGDLTTLDTGSVYEAALKTFQTDQGLTSDGVWDVVSCRVVSRLSIA
jgi:hypothetical protein